MKTRSARSFCKARSKVWEERNLWKRSLQEAKAAKKKAVAAALVTKPAKKNKLERTPDADLVTLSATTKEDDGFFLVPEKNDLKDDFYTVPEKNNTEDDFFLVPEKKD